jgi:hypothetical protein
MLDAGMRSGPAFAIPIEMYSSEEEKLKSAFKIEAQTLEIKKLQTGIQIAKEKRDQERAQAKTELSARYHANSFTDMLAAGKYEYVHEQITAKNFPIEGRSSVRPDIQLFHFHRSIRSDEVIREMEQSGFVPCKIEHLLTLGIEYPDLQRKQPIICLGSSCLDPHDCRHVPCLTSFYTGRRGLYLYLDGKKWASYCCFVAIRKS